MGAVLAFPLERRFNDLGERIGDYRGEGAVVILPVVRIERQISSESVENRQILTKSAGDEHPTRRQPAAPSYPTTGVPYRARMVPIEREFLQKTPLG